MSLLQQLASPALIGTERTSPGLPDAPAAFAELFNQMKTATESSDTLILRAAGVLSIGALAGFEPLPITHSYPASPVASQAAPQQKVLLSTLQDIVNDAPQLLWVAALLWLGWEVTRYH
mgnify:CR=1 FL=1